MKKGFYKIIKRDLCNPASFFLCPLETELCLPVCFSGTLSVALLAGPLKVSALKAEHSGNRAISGGITPESRASQRNPEQLKSGAGGGGDKKK